MKKVSINKFSQQGKQYVVCLGNGTATAFNQKQQAQQFLNQTGQFLTAQLYALRQIYKAVNDLYIDSWGYFRHDKKTMNAALYASDRAIQNNLRTVENSFNICIDRSQWTNGNYFSFYHLQTAIDSLKNGLKELGPVLSSKSIAAESYKIDFLFSSLLNIETDLYKYAQAGAVKLLKIPFHKLNTKTEYTPKLKAI